jgi:metallo-beta-lactamase family protein
MHITFCGANQEVTGSCYLIETSNARIVLDCGMFQGERTSELKNHEPFPFDPSTIQAMVLTHAHFDHTGRIPKLYKEGFRGKIFCTSPTADLSMITLRDAAHLMADEAKRHDTEPLYTLDDVEPLEGLFTAIEYHQEISVAPGVTAYFADAGHILGSASIKIVADGTSVCFSGDLGNAPVPLLHTSECLMGANAIVIESTYGNRVHESAVQRTEFIRGAILDTVRTKGTLLIPAFAIERSQELLYELNLLHSTQQIPANLPIYLDSPMAIAATEVFRAHTDYFDSTAQKDLRQLGDLFRFPGLRFTKTADESKKIAETPGPKVIIAGSGMMNGGRILHHLRNNLASKNTIVLIVGYQVQGSLGRRLHEGERNIKIYGQDIAVQADIRSCGAFSGHADYPRLMQWLHCFQSQPPQHIYVTHGEITAATAFSGLVTEQLGITSHVPMYAERAEILAR